MNEYQLENQHDVKKPLCHYIIRYINESHKHIDHLFLYLLGIGL